MNEPEAADEQGRVRGSRQVALAEAVVAAIGASLVAAVLWRAQAIKLIHDNLHAFVAAVFLFLPQLLLRRRGDLDAYGLRARPVGLGLKLAGAFIFGILPLFAIGFWLWLRLASTQFPWLVPGSVWHVMHPSWRLPTGFPTMVLAQLVVVALPEELFFRGFVQGRLEDALPPSRTFLGAKVGWAIILQAALFGLGHFLVTGGPGMLTRAIPGLLFGWLFARTRSILAGTLFHAACNLLMEVLASSLL